MILNQFDSSIWSFILLMILLVLYPKLYIWQILFKLETQLKEFELYANTAENYVLKKISKQPTTKLKKAIDALMSFFIVEPVSVDPFGIIKKIEHVLDESERRFDIFVSQVAPAFSVLEKANLKYGLMASIGVNQIHKIVRHYVLTIKKTGNLQLAMLLQMIMPQLIQLTKAYVKCTNAFVNGIPIGDAAGPLVAASFKTKAGKEIAKEVVVSQEKIAGKKVWVMKASGPGSALGKLGDAVEKLVRKNRIDNIITIDAAGKLEGEITGEVAEGVGVTMSGVGFGAVDRSKIEDVSVKNSIPLDGVAIKMAPEEAPVHLKKEVYQALRPAREIVERLVKDSKKKRILIIGVGNTCGIGNTAKEIKGLDERLKPIWAKQKKEEEEGKKKLKRFFGMGAY